MNKIESRITFKLKNGYSFELLTLKTMEWLVAKKKWLKKKNVSEVGRVDIAFWQSSLVHNYYQMNSRNSLSPINLSSSNFVHLKSYKSEFSKIKVWFTNQDFRLIKIENKLI